MASNQAMRLLSCGPYPQWCQQGEGKVCQGSAQRASDPHVNQCWRAGRAPLFNSGHALYGTSKTAEQQG
eukprot:1144214-Pelagomonas_calceolata.AAC.3